MTNIFIGKSLINELKYINGINAINNLGDKVVIFHGNEDEDVPLSSTLKFKGYEGEMIPSELTGAKRLKYDRSKPFSKDVTYKNYFVPQTEIIIPTAYIIPQGWHNIMDLLKLNMICLLMITFVFSRPL